MSQGSPGRYQRTFPGLIASMVVIVGLVLGFVVYTGLFRDPETLGRPEGVEYLPTVRDLQAGGLTVVYPGSLPPGWDVTLVSLDREVPEGDAPRIEINLFTPDDRFVGIRQSQDTVADLVSLNIDENASSEDGLSGVGSVAATWEGWADDGGDHGFSTVLTALPGVTGDTSVLVYGREDPATLQQLVALLTTDPVPAAG
ncbi:DUF4245 family protein [Nocardioides sp.]|uniref:DUF4245 family protein n=1 Tax=Nocardioides sp. TaxID=35761 RepID=UPI003516D538